MPHHSLEYFHEQAADRIDEHGLEGMSAKFPGALRAAIYEGIQ